jgi:hypothetical protein
LRTEVPLWSRLSRDSPAFAEHFFGSIQVHLDHEDFRLQL